MLLIVDYNKDPQKDMNDNLQSIYQYLWTKEIEREQRLKRFSPQDIYQQVPKPVFKKLLKVLNVCSSFQ